jgi:drug/metabolite transporter (DMT)-like permease
MTWFYLALIGPILWSIVNHLDKYLIEKYFKNRGIGSLIIFSTLIGFFIAPIIYIIHPEVWDISMMNKLLMVFVEGLNVFALWLYFKSLRKDEASVVIPFFQLIPVFGYVFGYIMLGEVLTTYQLLAIVLIIFGVSIISFEIDEENKFQVKKETIIFMTTVSLLLGFSDVLYKKIAIVESFWVSSFWGYAALGVIGILILIFNKKYRKEFVYVFRRNNLKIIGLNGFSEVIAGIGNLCTSAAYLLVPITLVLTVNSFQPLFVFILGILITLFIPKLSAEKIKLVHIFQKILAILIIGVGTFLLFA